MAFRYVSEKPRHRRRDNRATTEQDFGPFHKQLGEWFDGFIDDVIDFPFSLFDEDTQHGFSPSIDVRETDHLVEVMAELPGMNEKDISVTLKEKTLTIKGEKKTESEDKKDQFHRVERLHGAFERSIHLPADIDSDAVKAKYKNGVLTISMPKLSKKDEGHQIEVQGT